MNPDRFAADVAIVGGGPAGLDAARVLGQAGRRVIRFGGDAEGSGSAAALRAVPTDAGERSAELWRLGPDQPRPAAVALRRDRVIAVRGADGGFALLPAGGRWVYARKVLLADDLPDDRSAAHPRSILADDLGCVLAADGQVVVDDRGRTSVPGVFAASTQPTTPQRIESAALPGTHVAAALLRDLAVADAAARHAAARPRRPLTDLAPVLEPTR